MIKTVEKWTPLILSRDNSKGSKAGRAFFHGAADVLTIGLWEIVGTPIEGSLEGNEVQVVVYYDNNDRVERIKVFQGEEKLKGVNSDNLPNLDPDGDTMNIQKRNPNLIGILIAHHFPTSPPLGSR